jgi:hypothetical protein
MVRDDPGKADSDRRLQDGPCGRLQAREPRARPFYQCTPFIRFAIATCSIEAFSFGSFLPDAAAESGNTL